MTHPRLTGELGRSQMQAMQQFEEGFKTKLNAAISEVHEVLGRANLAFLMET